MSNIAVCYFSYYKDADFLNESLKHLAKTIEREKEHNVKVYVFDDARCNKKIKKSELSTPCTLISTKFDRKGNLNGYECIRGMFAEYVNIYKNFKYDYLIKLDSDCVLNTFDNIVAVETRRKKNNNVIEVGQIGSFFAQVCCYGCCQTFTPHGISAIQNIINTIETQDNAITKMMKKRIDLGWNEDKVVSLLLEMSPLDRCQTEALQHVRGHLNAFEKNNEDLHKYTSVAFKPNKYSLYSMTREEALENMKKFVASERPVNDAFYKFLKGKTVALVGNATPTEDYSKEIDSADVVIRMNNFYNYSSGKVGKKTDCLILNGIAATYDSNPNLIFNDGVISSQKPNVFVISETRNQDYPKIHDRYKYCKYQMLGNKASDLKYTSGTFVLKMIAEMDDVKCKVYGFDTDEKLKSYIQAEAPRHLKTITDENSLRLKLMEKIQNK